MIPGEVMTAAGEIELNAGSPRDHVDGCQHG
jgi:urease beta subunit